MKQITRFAVGSVCVAGLAVASFTMPSLQSRAFAAEQAAQGDIIQVATGPGMATVTTLVKAVKAAGLVDALKGKGPFTVFAPTNDAFAKLPPATLAELLKPENKEKLTKVLLYHVHAGEAVAFASLKSGRVSTLNGAQLEIKMDGPTVMVNGATITKSDVIASNGVIHWVDTVILPPDMGMVKQDIIQVATGPGMGTVTTLVKAVQAAALVEALKGPGPFTVFAPTNDAFAKLPPKVLADLLKPENKEKLTKILLYHVHAGEALAASGLTTGRISTLHGKELEIKVDGPTVMVNGATITKTDVQASNGVIHWIDTVIVPE